MRVYWAELGGCVESSQDSMKIRRSICLTENVLYITVYRYPLFPLIGTISGIFDIFDEEIEYPSYIVEARACIKV